MWRLALDLANDVYLYSKHFPEDERFGLRSQMRRCSVSIPSNIAEGAVRHSPKEFANFVGIALGSLAELDTQLVIAQSNGLIAMEPYQTLVSQIDDIGKMLMSLRATLQQPTKNNVQTNA